MLSVPHVGMPAYRCSLLGMENELSMNSRAEVTTRYAKAYVKAAKGDKGRIPVDSSGKLISITDSVAHTDKRNVR